MSAVKDENFVAIQGWMLNKLNLKGNELIVYAVIYGFSQDDESRFTGSRRYLAEWCGCTLKTVDNALSSLVAKGLIAKHDKTINGVHLCDYSITQVGKNLQQGTVKITQGVGKNLQQGTVKITHHNIEDNLDIDTLEDKIDRPKRKRFVAPSLEEVKEYCNERHNSVDAQSFLNYYEMTGWKTKGGAKISDWKACVRTWERKERANGNYNQRPSLPPERQASTEERDHVAALMATFQV
nr:MAG TPA: helix-turn-helix domain protein [Caudoviricetes sp.]